MKKIFLLVSRNRRNRFFRWVHKIVYFLYFAFENKNNDHATNGEFWLMDQLSKYGPTVIFDVGANVGKWSVEAHKLFTRSTIFAFEPIPEVFSRLKENVSSKA